MKVRIVFKGGASSIDAEVTQESYEKFKKSFIEVKNDTTRKTALINPSSISYLEPKE